VSPSVSVIICCYTQERLRDVRDAVASLRRQSRPPEEIIVAVDNNRGLHERLQREFGECIQIVLNEGLKGLSATRNTGVAAAQGDLIAFMDDDAMAVDDWLECLIQPFGHPMVMAVGGRAVPLWPGGCSPRWFPEEFDFIVGCTGHKKLILEKDNEVRSVTGSNMCFRREVFEHVGGWNSELGRVGQNQAGGEEAELCLRIKHEMPGAVILYEHSAVVSHKVLPQRASLKYVFTFCLKEGTTRAKLRAVSSAVCERPLAAENVYLHRLISASIPGRLRRAYCVDSLAQTGVIVANILLMGVGYVIGRCVYR
jgi:cellulose synthase/poly-beta-1,6-N-acetylglucosamine synthase-like glycosyltransferase